MRTERAMVLNNTTGLYEYISAGDLDGLSTNVSTDPTNPQNRYIMQTI